VEVLQSEKHASNEKFSLLLAEPFMLRQMVSKVASSHQINDKIEIFAVLKGVIHIDEEWVVEGAEEFLFVDDGVDTSFGDDTCFQHFLHGKKLVCFLLFDFPDFTEATATNNVEEREIILVYFFYVLLAL